MKTKGTGFIRDPAQLGSLLVPLSVLSSTDLPDECELSSVPVSDQGAVSQCVAHAILDCIYCLLANSPQALESVPSHRLGYFLARAIDRTDWTPGTAPLMPLQDNGCQPNQLIRALARFGCALSRDIDGGTIDAVPGKANSEITLWECILCKTQLYSVVWSRIGDAELDKTAKLAQLLANGRPFALAIEAGGTFRECGQGELLDYTNAGADHMVLCRGYRTRGGKRQFLIQNSWGPQWGTSGVTWSSEEFVRSATNILSPAKSGDI